MSLQRAEGGDPKVTGPQQREAAPHLEGRAVPRAVGHLGTVMLLCTAPGQLVVVDMDSLWICVLALRGADTFQN